MPRAPRLSRATEKMLASPECKPLSREDEERLILQAQRGNLVARNRVILSQARLAADKILGFLRAAHFQGDSSLVDDMLHDVLFGHGGDGGVLRAIGKFEPERGLRFSALLQQWILGEINAAWARRRQLGAARRTQARRAKLLEVKAKLAATQGTVTLDELHEAAASSDPQFSRTCVEKLLQPESHIPATEWSIDRPEPSRGHQRHPEQLIDRNSPARIEASALAGAKREQLLDAVAELPERSRLVIAALYLEERKLGEVAAELMLSPQHVRVIANEALAQLRGALTK